MKLVFLMFVFTTLFNLCFSQIKLSKKKILIEWNRIEKINKERLNKEQGNQYKKLPFNPKVTSFIDSLEQMGVDTIGVFTYVSVGYYNLDTCDNEISPWISYLQWKKNGAAPHNAIRQYCENPIISIPYSTIINYYNNCSKELKEEKIIPSIKGCVKDKDGKLSFLSLTVDHTVHFTIFCKQFKDYIQVNFKEYDLEEKQNIFYEENNNSRIKSWKNIIENQINEIEKSK